MLKLKLVITHFLMHLGHGNELAERVKLDAFSPHDIKKIKQ
jgi:hypothetical protein